MKKLAIALFFILVVIPVANAQITFTVINTNDTGVGSLRQAIIDANTNAGADIIKFNIPGASTHSIVISSKLPNITSPVTINGFTQTGAVVGNLWAGTPHTLMIEVDGSGETTPTSNSLAIFKFFSGSEGSLIKGLAINNSFGTATNQANGISIRTRNIKVESCYIGTNITGTAAKANKENGIEVTVPSSLAGSVTIGGTNGSQGNLISGHLAGIGGDIGIRVSDAGAQLLIQNNFIGTNASGSSAIANHNGISLRATNNTIIHNLISGNTDFGMGCLSAGDVNFTVKGCYIGTDRTGLIAIPNKDGISSWNNTSGTLIIGGQSHTLGECDGDANLISGNLQDGFLTNGTINSTFEGNFVGVDVTGNAVLANTDCGFRTNGLVTNFRIGGTSPLSRNVISGNIGDAISIDNGTQFSIIGNYIGTNKTGTAKLASAGINSGANGINVLNSTNSIIQKNIINSYKGSGIWIRTNISAATNINIFGNFIGTDLTGNTLLGNTQGTRGIFISSGVNAVNIGDGTFANRNVVSGSGESGVLLDNLATNITINKNLIGTNLAGTQDFGNQQFGIDNRGQNNTIKNNIISGNDLGGIAVSSNNTAYSNNTIGLNITGTALPNGGPGILVNPNPAFTDNSFISNAIAFNTSLGLDLGNNGVTVNDVGDADSGANALLNFPVLTTAIGNSVTFTLDVPAGNYRIEFFSNPSGTDPSLHGEGQIYVGFVNIVHAGGSVNYTQTISGAASATNLSATTTIVDGSTDGFGSTSEFSNTINVQPQPSDCTDPTADVFSIAPVTNAVSYAWTVTPSGPTLTVAPDGLSVSVDWTTGTLNTEYYLCVTVTDNCATLAPVCYPVIFKPCCELTVVTCPPTKIVECGQSIDPSNTGNPSYTSDCDVVVTYTDSTITGGCSPNTGSFTRTFTITATDNFGSQIVETCTQTITIQDTSAPVIATTAINNQNQGCQTAGVIVAPIFTATDICIPTDLTTNIVVTTSGPSTNTTTCLTTQTWTANVSDVCGNTALPVSITYTWTDANCATTNAGENGNLTICEGTFVTEAQLFDALGGTPDTTGTWSPAITATSGANTYTYTVSPIGSCPGDSATVTVIENIVTATIAPVSPVLGCAVTQIILSTSTSTTSTGNSVSYQWSDGAGNIAGETNSTYTATTIGTYTVTVTDNVTNCKDTASITISEDYNIPVLSVGDIVCNSLTGTYSVTYVNLNAANVTMHATGVGINDSNVDPSNNTVNDIPFGQSVTIFATNDITGCSVSIDVLGIAGCPTICVLPTLTVGQAVCDGPGSSTYSVAFNSNFEPTSTSGTVTYNPAGYGVISGIPITDTEIIVTAINGSCIVRYRVHAPLSCDIPPCENPTVSVGGTNCSSNGSGTYEVTYITIPGATVVSNHGNYSVSGIVTDIPNLPGIPGIILTVSYPGCDNIEVFVPASFCATCVPPLLSLGDFDCNSNGTYNLTYFSNALNITTSSGTVNTATNTIENIQFSDSPVIIGAVNGTGCLTVINFTGPTSCPACKMPDLVVGQGVCNGINSGTYSIDYTETTGATITIISLDGNTTYNNPNLIPVGVDVNVTATNGICTLSFQVDSPENCSNPCTIQTISIGGTTCAADGSATYSVSYVATAGATVTATPGTVDTAAGMITGIPSGTPVTITVSYQGCPEETTIVVPAATCPECVKPTLTASLVGCNAAGTGYNVTYFASEGAVITASAGTVTPGMITDIPLGTNVTITATSGIGVGCNTSITITGLTVCPVECNLPELSVGQAICNNNNSGTYSISYTETTGATVTITSIDGSTTYNNPNAIPVGSNIIITASNGPNCVVEANITSPVCPVDLCEGPNISIGGTTCAADGSATYSVSYVATAGAIVTSNFGNSTVPGIITGIPSGTDVTINVSIAGCPEETTIVVPAATCPECVKPTLTASLVGCNAAGTGYNVTYFASTGAVITASAGNVTAGMITDILLGENVTITATSGIGVGCNTSITITGLTVCPVECNLPELSVGQAICNNNNSGTYSISYTETTGATVTITSIDGSTTYNNPNAIPVGSNIIITASNGPNCVVEANITSPVCPVDLCEGPNISIGGTTCAADGSATYSVSYVATAGAIVTSNFGNSTVPGIITGIPSGTDVTINVSIAGCPEETTIVVPAATCPECVKPTLTASLVGCNAAGTGYNVTYFASTGAVITASAGNVTAGMITDILLGENVTITATSGIGVGCNTSITITGLTVCPVECNLPELSVGQAICNNNNSGTYSISYTETTGATVTITSIDGSTTYNNPNAIPVGSNIIITASNGPNCVVEANITSPVCPVDLCEGPNISIGGTTCAADGSATYSVSYVATAGAIVTSNFGNSTVPGIITGIPSGTDVTINVSIAGCPEVTTIVVPAATCPECVKPTLTASLVGCNAAGTGYNVSYFASTGAVITASAGNVTAGMITDIPLGENVTITATSGIGVGCTTSITITGLATCPPCNLPELSVGQAICNGNNSGTYSISYTETTGATVTITSIDGSTTYNNPNAIPVGSNVIVTASSGAGCVVSTTITSPVCPVSPCVGPIISIGGTTCAADGSATYSVSYVATAGAIVTSNFGNSTVPGIITGIPSGTPVTITASYQGCPEVTTIVVPAATCPECVKPTLTASLVGCNAAGTGYNVSYFASTGAVITASAGNVTAGMITDIPLGENVTITATSGIGVGCTTSITITGLATCPPCNLPELSVGQAICNGNNSGTYSISYTETTGATVTITSIDGSTTYNNPNAIPVGSNVIVTASSGAGCVVSTTITSPVCPVSPCVGPIISIGGTTCAADGSATYSVSYVATAGATVTSNFGNSTVPGIITGIPSGTPVTITASYQGCPEVTTIVVPAATCPECVKPTLTASLVGCNAAGTGYNVSYFASTGAVITASAGNVTAGMITDIPLGENVTIIATNGIGVGCTTSITITGLATCPPCNLPELSVGQAICNGNNSGTYSISYTETTGATVTITSIDGSTTYNNPNAIPVGSNVIVTASSGAGCVVSTTITSPVCPVSPCVGPIISIGGTTCAADGSATYSVSYVATAGAIVTSNFGNSTVPGIITGIPSGTPVTITASYQGCPEVTTIVVPAATCPECVKPTLTASLVGCNAAGTGYNVSYFASTGAVITASAGNVTAGMITDIPLGENVTITATSGIGVGCTTSITITGLATCPPCNLPELSVGQAICNGNNSGTYSISYTETTGATVTITSIDGSTTYNNPNAIPVGSNVIVTASSGAGCVVSTTITSPVCPVSPCVGPIISIGGTTCAADGSATYSVSYVATAGAIVTSNFGNSTVPGIITGIPSGTPVTITASYQGCPEVTTIVVPAATCPVCNTPVLTLGVPECNTAGTGYTMTYISNGTSITLSPATVGTVDIATNTITITTFGVNFTVTAANALGCDATVMTVVGLTTCPSPTDPCTVSDLEIGQAICQGTGIYVVDYTETTGAPITVVGGTLQANGTITASVGTNITVTVNAGTPCASSITVASPADCTPNLCIDPAISIGGTTCNGDGTYNISFIATAGATVTASSGTVTITGGIGTISGILSGTDVTVTVSIAGCPVSDIIVVSGPDCPVCNTPVLTLGVPECNTAGTGYTMTYISNGTSITLSPATVGTVDIATNTITITTFGVNFTVTAANALGCDATVMTVVGLTTCPSPTDPCTVSDLEIGQAICQGTGIYVVDYTETTGAPITVVGGTLQANGTITASVGTNITVTVNAGTPCASSITVASPADCTPNLCIDPAISIGGTTCNGDGTYNISFIATAGATVTASSGTVTITGGIGTISGILSGTDVTVTVSIAGCPVSDIIVVSGPDCPVCNTPVLTLGVPSCNTAGTAYTMTYISNGTSITLSPATVGTVDIATNTITITTFGVNFTVTAANALGCDATVMTVVGLTTCPSPTDPCTVSDLEIGQAICQGTGIYVVDYTETTGAPITVVGGTLQANGTITASVGTNITVTVNAGTPCASSITVASPADCTPNLCIDPAISIGGTTCNGDGTYNISFIATAGATVTASSGTVTITGGIGTISGILSGTDVTVTVSIAGCPISDIIVVSGPDCPVCNTPVLTLGVPECNTAGTGYTMTYISNGTSITLSPATVGTVDIATNTITITTFGVNFTVTAANALGCDATVMTVVGLTTCPSPTDPCTVSDLEIGQAICQGTGIYVVDYTETTGAPITVVGGTLQANGTITASVGTNITVTVNAGTPCASSITVASPTDCTPNLCIDPAISIGGTTCNGDGTYNISFVATAGATVTASSGTVTITGGIGTISGILSGTDVTVTVSIAGCPISDIIVVSGPDCPVCNTPVLTLGVPECNTAGTGYTMTYISNGTSITLSPATVGTVDIATNTITITTFGVNFTVTAANALGCDATVMTVVGLTTCPSPTDPCTVSDLEIGQAICQGTGIYVVDYTETTGAPITVVGGTLQANGTITASVGTNITVTVNAGTPCASSITVASPTDCTPNLCIDPAISIGGTTCNGDGTYNISFVATAGATVTASSGTVTITGGIGTISGILSGTDVTVTVSIAGCPISDIIVVSGPDCPVCNTPVLTLGVPECNTAGTGYTMTYISNGTSITLSPATVGTVDIATNTITITTFGVNFTVTAANALGCDATVMTVVGLTTCPSPTDPCTVSDLEIGQAICQGTGIYVVDYTETTGAPITVVGGTLQANGTITASVGTNITVTVNAGTPCASSITVASPADCTPNLCIDPAISIGGTTCNGDGTYNISFIATAGATVTASSGTVTITGGIGTISGILSGTDVTVTVSIAGCPISDIIVVSGPDCPVCNTPVLTLGVPECNTAGTGYTMTYISNGTSITLSPATVGTVDIATNTITITTFGVNFTVTAANALGCDATVMTVVGLTTCPSPTDPCTVSDLEIGQAICQGTGIYVVDYTETTGAPITVVGGTLQANGTITASVGTNITVTVNAGTPCASSITVASPADCTPNLCIDPAISIGGTTCNGDGTYNISFIATAGATVTASSGTVTITGGIGTISGILSGTDVTVTVSIAGCPVSDIIVVSGPDCPVCNTPVLTLGVPECNTAGTGYTMTYISNGTSITLSPATVGTVDIATNTITITTFGVNFTVTAANALGCDATVMTVVGLTTCPSPTDPCTVSDLEIGQAICQGTGIYVVDYTETTGAPITVVGGTLQANGTITASVGTNITVTVNAGTPCASSITVASPADCTPNLCIDPAISIGGTTCNGDGTYNISFIATAGATVTASSGTVTITGGIGTISGILSGTDVTVTVSIAGCPVSDIIVVSGPDCPVCNTPVLTLGVPSCNTAGTAYTMTYISNGTSITLSPATVGTVDIATNTITITTFGVNFTVTAANALGCDATVMTVVGLTTCPSPTDPCTVSDLEIGQAICQGTGIYVVDYTETTGAPITVVGGTLQANGTITASVGTNITVTVNAGTPCASSITVASPADCTPNLCIDPAISIGGTTCNGDGTYNISFIATAGATVTASSGTVTITGGIGTISGILSGTDVTVTVSIAGCPISDIIVVSGPDCIADAPSIAVVKTAMFNDENGDESAQVGETITYNFVVTNTGNTVLNNITIEDLLPGLILTGGPITLNPGESDDVTFVGTYALTQQDLINGYVTNQAVVSGQTPGGINVIDESDDDNVLENDPTIIEIKGCNLNVYNAVSPNGDGKNDVFFIGGIECYPNNTVEVYNRWGVLVYSESGYNNTDKSFNGYSNGRVTIKEESGLPTGTYFYIINYTDLDGNGAKKAGHLYIINN